MKTKHTPGPWLVSSETRDVEGDLLFCASVVINHDADYRGDICSVQSCDHLTHGNGIDKKEAEANAKLISAAPDLLEALKAIQGIEPWIGDAKVKELFMSKVYPAIKKATV